MIYLGENAIGLNHMISQIGSAARIECGTYTPTEDVDVSTVWISHSLGVEPDFIFYNSNLDDVVNNTSESYLSLGSIIRSDLFLSFNGEPDSLLSTTNVKPNTTTVSLGAVSTTAHMALLCSDSTHSSSEVFRFPYSYKVSTIYKLKANITYHYILGKFNEQEVTAND